MDHIIRWKPNLIGLQLETGCKEKSSFATTEISVKPIFRLINLVDNTYFNAFLEKILRTLFQTLVGGEYTNLHKLCVNKVKFFD